MPLTIYDQETYTPQQLEELKARIDKLRSMAMPAADACIYKGKYTGQNIELPCPTCISKKLIRYKIYECGVFGQCVPYYPLEFEGIGSCRNGTCPRYQQATPIEEPSNG